MEHRVWERKKVVAGSSSLALMASCEVVEVVEVRVVVVVRVEEDFGCKYHTWFRVIRVLRRASLDPTRVLELEGQEERQELLVKMTCFWCWNIRGWEIVVRVTFWFNKPCVVWCGVVRWFEWFIMVRTKEKWEQGCYVIGGTGKVKWTKIKCTLYFNKLDEVTMTCCRRFIYNFWRVSFTMLITLFLQ